MVLLLLIFTLQAYSLEQSDSRNSKHGAKYYNYRPDWADLDTRPAPKWYDSGKIGIFVHWGPYAVPCYSSEWFWFELENGNEQVKNFMAANKYDSYLDFPQMFTAEHFDPDKWAQLFADAGARYVVLTSKHHDGFALFPSGRSNWNSLDVGPKGDIVGALSESVRKHNMKFGLYYSLYEWFNKLYRDDSKNYYTTTNYTDTIVWPDIKYLINEYKPSVLWSDGDRDASCTYWKSRELLAWIYNESPVRDEIVVNDRWGHDMWCKHGDFFNCADSFNPGYLMPHKWEDAFKLDKVSWGCRTDVRDDELVQLHELLRTVVSVVSCGGNALINVGPTKEGIIPLIFEERLLQLGEWLKINGEAIYDTSPWLYQNDTLNPDVWYTGRKQIETSNTTTKGKDIFKEIYAFFLKWPIDNILRIGSFARFMRIQNMNYYNVELLGPEGPSILTFTIATDSVTVYLPGASRALQNYAWALKISAPNRTLW